MMFFKWVTLSALICGSTLARAEEIRVVSSETSATKCYSENGEPKGFMLETLIEGLKSAGYTPKVQTMPFKRALDEAKTGSAIIPCLFKTADREKDFFFSDEIGLEEAIVVTKKGKEFPVKSFSDLKGKKVGYLNGGSLGNDFEVAKAYLNLDVDNDAVLRLKKLEAGRVDAILINPGKSALIYQVKKAGLVIDNFSIVATLTKEPNYAAISKKAPQAQKTIDRLNAELKKMRSNGAIEKINKKYGF